MKQRTDVLLSLGSNFGDRKTHLNTGLERLARTGCLIRRISPIVESPAQLPAQSPSEWNRPFLNLVAIGETDKEFDVFQRDAKAIQMEYSKQGISKWSPRELDIDIVHWGKKAPPNHQHIEGIRPIFTRPYVLNPLLHIAPGWPVTDQGDLTALELSVRSTIELHIPIWMGILNVTPDSFSDGGRYKTPEDVRAQADHMIQNGVNIIDIGAESTRPNATALSDDGEWQRLQPAIEQVKESCANTLLAPEISVDTYHPVNAEKALNQGVDIINDVSGLRNSHMLALARESGKTFIAMHSITVPVDPKISIGAREDACRVFEKWVDGSRRLWEKKGLDLDKIVIDPGIGFGKSSLQALDLMRSVKRLRKFGHRVLIGHSRKRFLKAFSNLESSELDLETIGASLNLCAQSVDILRVHDVEAHTRAYLSWAHLLDNTEEDNPKSVG